MSNEPPFHPGEIAILVSAPELTAAGRRKGCPQLKPGDEIEIISEAVKAPFGVFYYFKTPYTKGTRNSIFHYRLRRKRPPDQLPSEYTFEGLLKSLKKDKVRYQLNWPLAGCRVSKDGKYWIPEDRVRETE